MKVKDIMTSPVQYCSPDNNLAEAAAKLWDSDCGALPVVDSDGRVIGMITDRDICMSAATKNRPPSQVSVWETSSGRLVACSPSDHLHDALAKMAHERLRRLPVVNGDGFLVGILSMNDLILRAEEAVGKKVPDLSYADVMKTLKAISTHRLLAAA